MAYVGFTDSFRCRRLLLVEGFNHPNPHSMNKTIPCVVVSCLLFGLAGCATSERVSSRIEKHQAYFNQLTPAQQEHIRNYRPTVGDKRLDVLIALGEPESVQKQDGKDVLVYIVGLSSTPGSQLRVAEPQTAQVHGVRPLDSAYADVTEAALSLVFEGDVLVSFSRSSRLVNTSRPARDPLAKREDAPPTWQPRTQAQLGNQ